MHGLVAHQPAVLDDLLHAFSGLDGRYVRARLEDGPGGARVAFALHGRPDAALRELTARMLPLWWARRPAQSSPACECT
jgi:hypothetical protein